MRAYLGAAVTGVLGFLTGLLVGLYVVGGGGTTLVLALVAIVATVAVPFIERVLSNAASRTDERIHQRDENRAQFAQHALELNSHAYQPMVGVVLQSPLENPPINGRLDPPGGSGIQVRLPDNQQLPIEGLPNWQFAMDHMLANAHVRAAWDAATAKAGRYYELRESTFNKTVGRFRVLLREEYGPGMHFSNTFSDHPVPWVDPEGLSYFVIGRRGPLNRREFFNPGGSSPDVDENQPRQITTGSGYYLWGRNAREAEPTRLQGVFDAVWADSELSAAAEATAHADREAKGALADLSERIRIYSNWILLSKTFEGECGVCRTWIPR